MNHTNVTNATVEAISNSSVTDTAVSSISSWWGYVPLALSRAWDLVLAPFQQQEMLWILFPLALTFLVLEFYFGRHGDEELGWAAAVANSLILFIIAIDLVRHSFNYESPFVVLKSVWAALFSGGSLPIAPEVLIMMLLLGALGVVVTLVNYYHLLPRKIAFEVSGHPPVNFVAFLAIVIVYTAGTEHAIPLDIITLIGGAILYIVILFGVHIVRHMWQKKKKKK